MFDSCEQVPGIFLCARSPETFVDITCETNILNNGNLSHCKVAQLPRERLLEFIPESNQPLRFNDSSQDQASAMDFKINRPEKDPLQLLQLKKKQTRHPDHGPATLKKKQTRHLDLELPDVEPSPESRIFDGRS